MRRTVFAILMAIVLSDVSYAQNLLVIPGTQSETITSINEDIDGNIIFSSLRGLYRYNGSILTPLIQNENVFDVIPDKDRGIIYMGIYGPGQIDLASKQVDLRDIPSNGQRMEILSYGTPTGNVIKLSQDTYLLGAQSELRIVNIRNKTLESRYYDNKLRSAYLCYDSTRKYIISANDHKITVFNEKLSPIASIEAPGDSQINCIIYQESASKVIVATNKGLYEVNGESLTLSPLKLFAGENILFVSDRMDSGLIVGVKGKGCVFAHNDGTTKTLIPGFTLDVEKCLCFVQGNGIIWLSPNNNGIIYYHYDVMETDTITKIEKTLRSFWLYDLCVAPDGDIWFIAGNQISRYDSQSGTLSRFFPEELGNKSEAISILVSSSEKLFVSTSNSVFEYDIAKEKDRFVQSFSTPDTVTRIVEDEKGCIYFKGSSTVYLLDEEFGFRESPSEIVPSVSDRELGYSLYFSGDYYFMLRHKGGEWEKIVPEDNNAKIHHGIVSSDECVWYVSRNNSSVYKYDLSRRKLAGEWTLAKEYYANQMHSLQEDRHKNIWIGTSNGLVRINPQNEEISYFNAGRKYDYYLFSQKDTSGHLYFAYSNGLTIFDPDDTSTLLSPDQITFYLPSIAINNEIIGSVSSSNQFITSDGQNNEQFVLPYHSNNLTFKCSYVDFDQLMAQYSYTLEGFDRQWFSTTESTISYSNLPKGKYTFKVKLMGLPESSAKTFGFEIKPAPWKTALAKIIYLLMLLGTALFVCHRVKSWQKRRATEAEQQIKDEISRLKINFFTNLSHEFRTPLTLLTAPLKDLKSDSSLSESVHKKVEVMGRSVTKLQQLSNQILEYNNVDIKFAELNLTQGDIVKSVKDIAETFQYTAAENGVTITMETKESIVCQFDEIKINRILSNLLSNAIKYSPGGGTVRMLIQTLTSDDVHSIYKRPLDSEHEDYVEIQVKDEGIGVSPEKLEAIFNRYERANDHESLSDISGFGIGLHYTRQLVTVHKGTIKAEQNHPKGSIFRFAIPLTISETSEKAKVLPSLVLPADEIQYADEDLERSVISSSLQIKDDTTILIVDDDDDIRYYLSDILCEDYEIISVSNGEEAVNTAKERFVNLIICDVMMPGMNGYQVCRELKSTLETSSIPIILLTAKSDMKSQIHGINIGADAYIGKPFEREYLSAVIRNLLRKQAQRQLAITTSTSLSIKDELDDNTFANDADKHFIQTLFNILDEHLSETEISIDFLTKQMGMSRTGFYMKIKSLTGKSPIQFISDYRMNKAEEMLRNGEYSIKEISYLVGYEARQSFTRSFKKTFGCNPTEYQEKIKQNDI